MAFNSKNWTLRMTYDENKMLEQIQQDLKIKSKNETVKYLIRQQYLSLGYTEHANNY